MGSKIEPGIFQRGTRWQIDTFYQGHRLRDSFATLPAARKNLLKMKTLVDEGRYLDKKRVPKETLGDLAERYLQWCEDIRQKDIKTKRQRIVLIEAKLGKGTPMGQITRATVEGYQADRLNALSRRHTQMKPATVNRELAALKHMFTKAVEWGMLEKNPAKGVKLTKENNRRLRYLTPEECQTLISKCRDPLDKIVDLALHTGMRKGEVLGLERRSVYLRDGYVEIVDQKNGERSTIPLNESALEVLRSIPPRLDSPYVFPGKDPSKPFHDLTRRFEKAVKAAGLEGVTFHTLRHTAASHMVMNGVDLPTVKEIMRHKSIATTLIYAHLSPGHRKNAVDKLEAALRAPVQADAEKA